MSFQCPGIHEKKFRARGQLDRLKAELGMLRVLPAGERKQTHTHTQRHRSKERQLEGRQLDGPVRR